MQRSVIATVVAAALFACVQIAAEAQTFVKPPRRLPANVSEQTRIPAGTDTATSATSDTLPLGTPVPPVGSVDRSDQNTRSAAARAAARPRAATTTSSADATRQAAAECPSGEAAFQRAMSACSAIANRSDRADCAARASQDRRNTDVVVTTAAPVALPGSGFVGSSTSPQIAADATGSKTTTRAPARLGCV